MTPSSLFTTQSPHRTLALDPQLNYPEPDGEPMAESDQAREALLYSVEALKQHFQGRSDVYVSGNLWISYRQGVEDAACAPDVFVIFGVADRARQSYRVWEEGGKTPDFVLEVTSKKTRNNDSVTKPIIYAGMGVKEYFQYDPTGDYLRPALQGFRLVEGDYQAINLKLDDPQLGEQMGLHLYSEVLNLELQLSAEGIFRFWNPQTASFYLPANEQLIVEQQKRAAIEQERDELRQQLEALRAELGQGKGEQ
ncbi:MAG: Uma2 family endonuclease [Cyanobacteria bacterium P01_G01_bin.54]